MVGLAKPVVLLSANCLGALTSHWGMRLGMGLGVGYGRRVVLTLLFLSDFWCVGWWGVCGGGGSVGGWEF